jgi:hypothetical protein
VQSSHDHGSFAAGSNRTIPYVGDAAMAEATALRDGLILAGNIGCNKIMVESDCIEVVEVMQNGGNSIGPTAAIYDECTFLCHNFTHVCFSHCPREANEVAHILASRVEDPHLIS